MDSPAIESPALVLKNIHRLYRQGKSEICILKDITLSLYANSLAILSGPSGCGKSTLLHIAALLDTQHSGQVSIDGVNCTGLKETEKTKIRRDKIGFIYQFHNLLGDFSAQENVALPLIIAGKKRKDAMKKAANLLEELQLQERLHHRPGELSGGEQQRVAVARAFANAPKILLADEPTGNLDPATTHEVFNFIITLAQKRNMAVFMVTHNMALAKKGGRRFSLHEGNLLESKT